MLERVVSELERETCGLERVTCGLERVTRGLERVTCGLGRVTCDREWGCTCLLGRELVSEGVRDADRDDKTEGRLDFCWRLRFGVVRDLVTGALRCAELVSVRATTPRELVGEIVEPGVRLASACDLVIDRKAALALICF